MSQFGNFYVVVVFEKKITKQFITRLKKALKSRWSKLLVANAIFLDLPTDLKNAQNAQREILEFLRKKQACVSFILTEKQFGEMKELY